MQSTLATVVWRDDAYTNQNYYGNGDNQTIGEKYMGLSKTVGILEERYQGQMARTPIRLYVNTDKYEDALLWQGAR